MHTKFFRTIAASMAGLLLTGCSSATDYALSKANYPELTHYRDAYRTVSQLESGKRTSRQKLFEAYDALSTAQNAYNQEIRQLREGAEDDCPDLVNFSADLSEILFAQQSENIVYSPVNLYLALAMLAESTGGETRQQITDLLDSDQFRADANALWRMIYQDGLGETYAANSMWFGDTYPVKQDLADTLAQNYFADTFKVPMGTAEADNAMQSWLNEHTGNNLTDAVKSIHTNSETVLALMSTLYFHNQWQNRFEKSLTAKDTFTKADGTEHSTNFMHDKRMGSWHKGENYVMAERHFQEGGKMLFILPDEGFLPEELLTDEDTMEEILSQDLEQRTLIKWSVPKFDFTSDLDLLQPFKALGITDVLDPHLADFSPTVENLPVFLSQAKHSARVTIDEDGCTAAAFTVLMANEMSIRPPDGILQLNLNRPFAFIIMSETNLPLFIGSVYEP